MYKIIEECILKLDYLKYSITDNSINKRWIVDRFSNGRFYFSFKKDQQHHDFNFTIFNYSRQLSFFLHLLFIIIFIYFFRSHTYNKFSRSYAQRKHIFRNIRSFFRSSFRATKLYFFPFLKHFIGKFWQA